MIRFWPTIKGLCHRKISLFCKKTVKKKRRDRFLRKSMVLGGAIKFLLSPITRVIRVVARNGFRCFTPLLKLFQLI